MTQWRFLHGSNISTSYKKEMSEIINVSTKVYLISKLSTTNNIDISRSDDSAKNVELC